jgi:hypothetical protein
LYEFIRANVRSMRRETSPGTPDVSECLEVVRVAKTSIASHAGIVPGDLLVSVAGRTAAKVGTDLNRLDAGERRYQLYSPSTGERLRLETTGVPIGIEVRPSPAAITATYQTNPDPSLLPALWEAGKWTTLERLASSSVQKPGLLGRLLGRSRGRNTPALVLLGAALYERGEKRKGLALIHEYEGRYARYWTMDYFAIARYYAGKERLAAKDERGALALFEKAYELNPCGRIAGAIGKLQGRSPGKPAGILGRRLPLEYDLPLFDGSGRVSLAHALETLRKGQLLAIVVLGSYRGNGPYDALMRRWAVYAGSFRDFLPALHVVTEKREREADRPDWYKGEDMLRLRSLPLALLLDRDGDVARAVQPPGSPWVFLADRERTVHHDGDLGDVEIWDALASARRAAAS